MKSASEESARIGRGTEGFRARRRRGCQAFARAIAIRDDECIRARGPGIANDLPILDPDTTGKLAKRAMSTVEGSAEDIERVWRACVVAA